MQKARYFLYYSERSGIRLTNPSPTSESFWGQSDAQPPELRTSQTGPDIHQPRRLNSSSWLPTSIGAFHLSPTISHRKTCFDKVPSFCGNGSQEVQVDSHAPIDVITPENRGRYQCVRSPPGKPSHRCCAGLTPWWLGILTTPVSLVDCPRCSGRSAHLFCTRASSSMAESTPTADTTGRE